MGRSLAYPLNLMYGDIYVADHQYQNNVYDYHLVNNINIAFNKIIVLAMDK